MVLKSWLREALRLVNLTSSVLCLSCDLGQLLTLSELLVLFLRWR